jgi:TatD DNase family protein
MSTSPEPATRTAGLPALDCHAHLAPDVTTGQLRTLGDAVIFAVTRSLDEPAVVSRRRDPQLLWGCGVHPGIGAALDSFDRERFERLAEQLVLIGEVGMDAHAGRRDRQRQVLTEILTSVAIRPMMVSVHSSGWPDQVVDLLAARPSRGPNPALVHRCRLPVRRRRDGLLLLCQRGHGGRPTGGATGRPDPAGD